MKLSCIAVSAALIATPALAQQASGNNAQVETVLVTGKRNLDQKTEVSGRLGLSIQETPATVDIITQQDFQTQGIRSSIEAMNSAPGVASGNLPGSIGSVSMRGFHRAVNYLYDGVRMPNSDAGMRNWDSWSFERIEVIKGPASVTSGEGALAGAINFVPRRPSLERVSGSLLASSGSFDTQRLAGDINVPLNETVAVRTNASWSRSSGWIDDTDSDTLAISSSLLMKPNERFSLTLSLDYFEDTFSTAYFGTPLVSRAVARNPSSAVSGSSGLVLDKAMRRVNFDLSDSDVSSDSTWLRARAEYELTDTIKIVSDTSYYDSFRNWQDADEYTFNNTTELIDRYTSYLTHDHQFWNQRVHVAVDDTLFGLRNRFMVGVEAGETDFFTKRRFGTATSVDPFAPIRGSVMQDTPANFSTRQDVNADVEQLAFFTENALNVTDKWLLVAGLRYDNTDLERYVENLATSATQHYGQTYEPLSWRLGSVYSVTPKTQLFAQYTQGVTPVSGLLFMSAANASFDLTTGESYEGGIKTSFAEDKAQLTASVFNIIQDDIVTRDPLNPAVTQQGGSQGSKGAELALNWALSNTISLALSGTLLEAEFRELVEAGGADRTGNRPANVPERLVDAVITYASSSMPITITTSVRHNDGFYTSNANNVKVNGFTTVDSAIAWQMDAGTLTLRGRNLTDEFYADWSGYASGLVFIGAPRSVDVTFTTSF
ncbi:MAG: TonB-dependent siderophore receptor [Cellvibrio sp.]|uniref:TonB-dependent receptor n=1 Tax=Cellvibrio sp. TaxID=1965322 RepID=UPI0031B0F4AF